MTPHEAVTEIGWVIQEAVALSEAAPPAGANIDERTAYVQRWQRYEQRKRELLDFIQSRERCSER